MRARTNREIDRTTSLAAWLAAKKEDGIVPDIPPALIDEARRTHYRNLPLDEFRALVDAVRESLTPDDDEPDFGRLGQRLAENQLSFLLGSFVGLRELNNLAGIATGAHHSAMRYGGPTGLRPIADVTAFAIQARQGEFDDAFRRSFINLMGDFTGLPSAQINRTWTGIEALADDETDNPAAVVFGVRKNR